MIDYRFTVETRKGRVLVDLVGFPAILGTVAVTVVAGVLASVPFAVIGALL